MSQSRVSRCYKPAQDQSFVRTVVRSSAGMHRDLEEYLECRFPVCNAKGGRPGARLTVSVRVLGDQPDAEFLALRGLLVEPNTGRRYRSGTGDVE
jgi:hypothetical protein